MLCEGRIKIMRQFVVVPKPERTNADYLGSGSTPFLSLSRDRNRDTFLPLCSTTTHFFHFPHGSGTTIALSRLLSRSRNMKVAIDNCLK